MSNSHPTVNPAVVVVAYNRPDSLARLLKSISEAHHPTGTHLYISIDGDASPQVISIAESFADPRLIIEVIQRPVRLGLRRHIIECGGMSITHGAVIILEDDLYLSPNYYTFATASAIKYSEEINVAGISLYSPEYNEFAGMKFAPMHNGYDTYPMQVPCSWGQCWTKSQWESFMRWYNTNNTNDCLDNASLPEAVLYWPETSWKKYFSLYMVKTNKYFIYPYTSLSTNCADVGGQHIADGSPLYQVALSRGSNINQEYQLVDIQKSDVCYDAFMEACGNFVSHSIGIRQEDIELDLYATKQKKILTKKTFAITSRKSNNPIQVFDLNFRPIEANIQFPSKSNSNNKTGFVLTKSEHIEYRANISLRLVEYMCGMNLSSGRNFRAIATQAPRIIINKITSRLLKAFLTR